MHMPNIINQRLLKLQISRMEILSTEWKKNQKKRKKKTNETKYDENF